MFITTWEFESKSGIEQSVRPRENINGLSTWQLGDRTNFLKSQLNCIGIILTAALQQPAGY